MRGAFLAAAAAVAGTAMADVAHMRRHDHFHHNRAYQPEAPAEGDENCECITKVITITGPPTLVPINTPAPEPSSSSSSSEVPSVPSVPSGESSSVVTSEAVTTLHSTSTATVTVVTTPGVDATGVQTPSGGVPGTPEPSTPAGTPEASTPAVPESPLPTPGVTSFSSTGIYTIPATTVTVRDTTTVCGATTTELPSGSHTFGGVTTVVSTATTVTCPVATVEPSGSTVTSKIYTTTYVCPSAGTYTIAPTTTYVPTSTVVVYPTPATITPGTYTQDEQTVTVTRTDFTYVCPFTGNDQPTSAPVAPSTSAVPVTTTAAPSTSSAVASSSASASSSATPVPTGVSGQQMGMTYSPYTNEGGCQSKDQVLKDVALIKQKGFTHVRVYSTDCNGLEYIGEAARQNGLKLIIGVFISSTGISGAQEQVTAISKWAQWDLVTLIVVGNEAIQNGYTDASSLAGFISSCKSSFQAAGYSGQVTTTEPINVWQQSGSALCGAVDVLGANLHPFFNADVTPDQAGTFVRSQIKDLEAVCNKDVINLETGWPSQGNANGKAVPGAAQQAAAIKALVEEVGSQSVFFSYSNDLWKDAGEFDVERYWGCIDQFK